MISHMKKIFYSLFIIFSFYSVYGNESNFNIAVSSLELTLNPFYTYTADEAQFLSGIYEGLVSYDPADLSPKPALAKTWTLSEDKTVYTFILRDNIKFSNGDKITSTTFKNSFIKLLSPDTQAEFASLLDIIQNAQEFRTGKILDPEQVGIKTDGDDKLIFTLNKRAPYFTKILCHHSFTPVHETLLNNKYWNIKDSISSGPYIIKRVENKLILQKNDFYWDKENVYFDNINLIQYTDRDKATSDFNKGNIDWLTDNTININLISDLDTLKVNPLFATTYYYFNTAYKEFKNPKIREAISLLIPWNKIREKQYIPANSLIPTMSNFPKNSISNDQNIEKALEILDSEGYKNGNGLSDIILSVPEGSYNDKFISDIIKENIEKNTNINVILKETPYPDFFTINRNNEFTISTLSWIGDFADPLTFLEMWTTNSNLNDSGFTNSEYDNLIRESSNLNQDDRYKDLADAEKILLEDYIIIPINHTPGINVIDTRYIKEWYPNTLDIHPYKYLRIVNQQVIPGLI